MLQMNSRPKRSQSAALEESNGSSSQRIKPSKEVKIEQILLSSSQHPLSKSKMLIHSQFIENAKLQYKKKYNNNNSSKMQPSKSPAGNQNIDALTKKQKQSPVNANGTLAKQTQNNVQKGEKPAQIVEGVKSKSFTQETEQFKFKNKDSISQKLEIANAFGLGESEKKMEEQNNMNQTTNNIIRRLMTYSQKQIEHNEEGTTEYFKDKMIKIVRKVEHKNENQFLQKTSLWLGEVFDKCASSSFKHFICKDLDYNEVKTYCCEQILSNILQHVREKSSNGNQMTQSITSKRSSSDKSNRKRKVIYESQKMKYLNQESSKILSHLCNKYPQTNIQGVNKQVSQIVEKINIDNWANDEYDILRKSGVKFLHKQNPDYSQQIMKFINFLISFPFQKHRRHEKLTNYKYFEKVMNKIFDIVFIRDSKDDIGKLINKQGQFEIEQQLSKPNQTKEDLDYMQRVKKYTTILMGSKIAGSTKLYSEQDIQSGIIKIDDNAVARVIDKWTDQLGSKFFEAQKNILHRTYRFKSADDTQFNKINSEFRQQLFNILCQKRKQLQQFLKELKQSVYDLSFKLASNEDSDVSSLKFLTERQRLIGQFAVKMSQSSSQYFIQILHKQICLLIESVQILKRKWVEKYTFKESPHYEALQINLVTLKIGDLMRCKIISNEEEIVRVLKVFINLSQMWDSKLIKIIRVKNRLEYGTRDVLINFMFDQICPCEIQLAVAQKVSEKQQYFDKFNHFLYELRRAFLGPVMEMCKIWNQYESKSLTFAKQIQKSTKKKIKAKKIGEQYKQIQFRQNMELYQYKLPFLCSSCGCFCPRNTIIYFNSLLKGKTYCGNCKRLKLQLCCSKKDQTKRNIYIFRKYIIRYPNFYKVLEKIYQIKNLQSLLKHKFQIHIPVHSHLVHMHFSMIIKLENKHSAQDYEEYAFVSTHISENGDLTQQICSQKISKLQKGQSSKTIYTIQQIQELFNEDYMMFGWDIPTKLIPLPSNPQNHYYELIDKLLPCIYKLQQKKGSINVKVGAIQVEKDRYYFFPFFLINQVEISDQLIQHNNLQRIISSIQRRQQVLEIQGQQLSNQWQELGLNFKLQLAYTVKQIYVAKNKIKNVQFIQHLHSLEIFDACSNEIIKIPNIPASLKELKLGTNKITSINKFIAEENAENYRLTALDLSYNPITKIQNISQIKQLQTLLVVRCQIGKIQGLPVNLRHLALGFNKIEKIENLDHLQKLVKVNLAGNLIQKIQNFKNCKNLSVLLLSRNKIQKIENIEQLQNLTILHLSYTGLKPSFQMIGKSKQNSISKGLKKIKRLLIEGNKILCLMSLLGLLEINNAQRVITPFPEMEEISVAKSEMRTLYKIEKAFPWIKIFNAQQNQIKNIDNFLNLSLLVQFNVSFNKITSLPEQGWEKIFKIKVLNLSNNQIKYVPNLSPLIFVTNLNLSSNKVVEIKGFPSNPVGSPDFYRVMNFSKNQLFSQESTQQNFENTLMAMQKLNPQSDINFLENGNSITKLDRAYQLKQQLQLSNTKIQQVFQ